MSERVSEEVLDYIGDETNPVVRVGEIKSMARELSERRAADHVVDANKKVDIIDLRNKVCAALGWRKNLVSPNWWCDGCGRGWKTVEGKIWSFTPDTRPEQLAMACVLAGVKMQYYESTKALTAWTGDKWLEGPIEIMKLIAERKGE